MATENVAAWEASGRQVAQRNLIFSILSEHVGSCVWSLWSVFILFLGKDWKFQFAVPASWSTSRYQNALLPSR